MRTYAKGEYHGLCHDSDGRNFCDCQGTFGATESCMFYGRHIEPLAFSLGSESVLQQGHCLLFTVVPKEIRDMVYDYAFTDCRSNPPNRNNKFREYRGMKGKPRPSDIAFSFLLTCKSIYLEAYRLPLLLNPLIVYDFQMPTRPHLQRLSPWQFALIQSVDISLQQISLESDGLGGYLANWRAKQRNVGAYVAPRFFRQGSQPDPDCLVQSFHFGLLGADKAGTAKLQDGDEVTLANKLNFYDRTRSPLLNTSTAHAMVARPLTRLTLRLSRVDWWTWSNLPSEVDPSQHLRLEPSFNDSLREVGTTMQELAEQRRAGQHPQYEERNWGAVVGTLPDLKTLELVLETWEVKKYQLKTVVECAKTWKFPLKETQCELVWDGKVESANWKREEGDEDDFVLESDYPRYATWVDSDMDSDMDSEDVQDDDEQEEDEDTESDSGLIPIPPIVLAPLDDGPLVLAGGEDVDMDQHGENEDAPSGDGILDSPSEDDVPSDKDVLDSSGEEVVPFDDGSSDDGSSDDGPSDDGPSDDGSFDDGPSDDGSFDDGSEVYGHDWSKKCQEFEVRIVRFMRSTVQKRGC
ncbi:hypothetical protein K458DRAFT_372674 [Lentithecium fluviatile CBS 122367]|uniref:Uncharacterized protein n=1 Tax=Lentithecium fluviatile CBS 122367 TaxID=1168545 RepID=A0A6G1ITF8_9PLEO|nr:hypothetical protein K458DRAFT_372674 [Lentithecium fluviatile CBS 122367]